MHPDLRSTIGSLERIGKSRPGGRSLARSVDGQKAQDRIIDTILPGSVEARAKIKMTLGHDEALPVESSFRVLDNNWRASRERASTSRVAIATGEAVAMVTRREMMARSFMLGRFAGRRRPVALWR